MKKGLRRLGDPIIHRLLPWRQALMKKGLRLWRATKMSSASSLETSPDEEGIKTGLDVEVHRGVCLGDKP